MRDSVPSARIPAFVMYCAYGTSRSSLLIESTDFLCVCICLLYILHTQLILLLCASMQKLGNYGGLCFDNEKVIQVRL